MEDQIASICAIISASLTGRKVMTAISGPGFSLMQEGLVYAVMTEIPCVVVNFRSRVFCMREEIYGRNHDFYKEQGPAREGVSSGRRRSIWVHQTASGPSS